MVDLSENKKTPQTSTYHKSGNFRGIYRAYDLLGVCGHPTSVRQAMCRCRGPGPGVQGPEKFDRSVANQTERNRGYGGSIYRGTPKWMVYSGKSY